MKKIGIVLLFLILLMGCTSFNKNKSVPISFFEVSNAILVDDNYLLNKYLSENPELTSSELNTLLIATLENNSFKSLKTLIDRGADINYINPISGRTPIFSVRSISSLNFLIDEGADLNIIDKNNISLLSYFIENKPLNYSEVLIENGVDLSNWNILLQASIKGSANLIKKMLENGADFSQVDKFGNYPIYYAYAESNILELLNETGYNLNQKNLKKENILGEVYLRAVANGYKDVIIKLWELGVNPYYTSYGDNAISIAVDSSNEEILKFLQNRESNK